MRLASAILWGLASLLWLPWALVLGRFVFDVASGTPAGHSEFLSSVFAPIWPRSGWLDWQVVSWAPIGALAAFALAYAGWRLFWWERDWRASYRGGLVALSILIPPLALALLYRDARRRFAATNRELQAEAEDARERVTHQNP